MKQKNKILIKMNKIWKPLATVTKKCKEKTQITNIKNERGTITINLAAIKKIIRKYYGQLYGHKCNSL